MLTNCLAACTHLTITVSEIQRDICEKIVILSYHLAFDARVRGFLSEYQHPFWDRKTRMVSLPDGEKISKIFIRFDVIHERDRRTDGHCMTAKTALMHMNRAVKTISATRKINIGHNHIGRNHIGHKIYGEFIWRHRVDALFRVVRI